MFNVRIDSNKAWVTERETLTLYSQGYEAVQIEIDFGDEWASLSKIAVFRAYDCQIDVAMTGNSVEIPVNVLLKPNVHLLFGVYGVNSTGTVVIPTIWADLGIIQPSPNPTDADNYGPPALGLYAQLEALAASAAASAATAASGTYAGSVEFYINGVTSGKTTQQDIPVGNLVMEVTTGGTTTISDLGTVTAYAAAKSGSPAYSGTYEQFQQLLQANAIAASTLAQVQSQLATVASSASTAVSTANTAASTATTAKNKADSVETTVGTLQTAVAGKQAQHHTTSVELASGATSWTINNVNYVTASNLVIWSAAPTSFADAAAAMVRMTAQGAGSVTFAATTAPSNAITINLAIFD